jgi:S1 RNA binding domain protein
MGGILTMAVEPGAIVGGTVERLLNYGVIVTLPDGESGMIHISEIANEYVANVSDYFREGDQVKVKVLSEKSEGRYELSAKQAEKREPLSDADAPREQVATARGSRPSKSFDEKLAEFMKHSSQRLNELRRSRDNRRKRGR